MLKGWHDWVTWESVRFDGQEDYFDPLGSYHLAQLNGFTLASWEGVESLLIRRSLRERIKGG